MARLLNRLLTFKLLAREDHDLSFYSSYSLIAYGFLGFLVFLVLPETKPFIVRRSKSKNHSLLIRSENVTPTTK